MQTSENSNQTQTSKNLKADSGSVEVIRDFDVPVNELFEAFTSVEALKIWWWPRGLYTDQVEIDFREGGKYFFNRKGFDEGELAGHFKEIVPNKRIVMSDIAFEFEKLSSRRSRIILSQDGIPEAMREETIKGCNESFDKLEAYLKK